MSSINMSSLPVPGQRTKFTNSKLWELLELVKFEHTIFALPFALSAMILAAPPGVWPLPITLLWVVLCMLGGRTYAMALNRLIDAEIDARNTRTQSRGIPAGRVQKTEAFVLALAAAALLTVAVFQLPQICQQLLPVAFLILTLYSFTKRFTSLCHLVLGLALGSSAVGGWLAVTGVLSWEPVIFGLAVVFWVSGFDIIYALQDVDFDRQNKLHSLPAWLGMETALGLSRVFHAQAVVYLICFGLLYHWEGMFYWLAVLLMMGMLVYEHNLIWQNKQIKLENINAAFFDVNGKISLAVLALVVLDKWVG